MILVTGGAGFIGSNIATALTQQNHRVIISDRLRTGDKWRNIAKIVPQRVVDPEILADFLKSDGDQISHVIHMGAISSTTASNVDEIYAVNFELSCRLWRFCASRHIPFIYASSAATYGDGSQGFDDSTDPNYLASLRPLNPYGWSKHLFDRWVLSRSEAGELGPAQCVGLKFFNVYGTNEYHKGEMRSVINKSFHQILAAGHVNLFKSYRKDYQHGEQQRDFVYVSDCVSVVQWLLGNQQISGLFNVGSGKARSFKELASSVFSALEVVADIRYIEMPEEIQPRYQYWTQANMSKLAAAGYTDQPTDLEQGIHQYIDKYLTQADPYA